MKSVLNVKKTSNLIEGISSSNICSGIKSQQLKKTFHIQYQKHLIFLRIPLPLHRVTFDHSISCVLLIDKPNESYQNSKKFKRNAISTTKKAEKKIVLHKHRQMPPISQTFSECLKLAKEKFTLHEVNFERAAKIPTIFYQ